MAEGNVTVDLIGTDLFERLAHELRVARVALLQAQEAGKSLAKAMDMRDNVMGRIAISALGDANNVTDEQCVIAVARLARVAAAARALAAEGQEYELDEGLCRAAPNSYWEDLDDALDDALDDLEPGADEVVR